ncbi:hypothetical protein N656DRAFT_79624 [Canariomyces notabilis]|uniref:Uncharacterized protein n=1 Tax=Canariomyces notabilis TaxID=2074819 RepID=A0AAN6YTS4_9PEZI|nr:hypothetical protein N656DRAFT_79624 [Canariomyces arenarius]
MWEVFTLLQNAKLKLLDSESSVGCSPECRLLQLGSLIKFLHDQGLPENLTATTSYEHLSVMDLIEAIRDINLPAENRHYPSREHCDCQFTLTSLLEPGVKKAAENLDIMGFCPEDIYESYGYCSWEDLDAKDVARPRSGRVV